MADDRHCTTIATQLLLTRDYRQRFFSDDLFDESAWDMLLTLFIAGVNGSEVGEDELIARTANRPSSGQRWLAHLLKEGEVERSEGADGKVTLSLAPGARDRMRQFLGGLDGALASYPNQGAGGTSGD